MGHNDPILAARSLPVGTDGSRVPLTLKVVGGLHYLRGNAAPYFSLTYEQHRKGFPNQVWSGGAGHKHILSYYPRFADLAALHLSDIDGAPMHTEGNGWYWLAGALGGAGEQYHGSNGTSAKTPDECLDAFARHCRITRDEATTIMRRMQSEYRAHADDWSYARAAWVRTMDAMRPRWKAEADAAIIKHNLTVYGDPWNEEAAS